MRWLGFVIAVAIVLATGRVAAADPVIVLVTTRGAPALPTLASQVEMFAGRRAAVETLDAHDEDPLLYADQATALVAGGRASIVVWIAPVDRGYLVFAAGAWPGRALTELVRVDAAVGDAELERTIALKLAALLDALLAPRPAIATAVLAIPPAPPGPAWQLELIGAASRTSGARGYDGQVALAAGRVWAIGAWRAAPELGASWQATGEIDGLRGAHASVTEITGGAALEAARDVGPCDVFARPWFAGQAIRASGSTADGRSGAATLLGSYVGLEAGARWPLADHLQLGLLGGADLALIHRAFTVDGQPLIDLGRWRLHVGLEIALSL